MSFTNDSYVQIFPITEELIVRLRYARSYKKDDAIQKEHNTLWNRYSAYGKESDNKILEGGALVSSNHPLTDDEYKKYLELGAKTFPVTKIVTKVDFIEVSKVPEMLKVKNCLSIPMAHFKRVQQYIDMINNAEPEQMTYCEFNEAEEE